MIRAFVRNNIINFLFTVWAAIFSAGLIGVAISQSVALQVIGFIVSVVYLEFLFSRSRENKENFVTDFKQNKGFVIYIILMIAIGVAYLGLLLITNANSYLYNLSGFRIFLRVYSFFGIAGGLAEIANQFINKKKKKRKLQYAWDIADGYNTDWVGKPFFTRAYVVEKEDDNHEIHLVVPEKYFVAVTEAIQITHSPKLLKVVVEAELSAEEMLESAVKDLVAQFNDEHPSIAEEPSYTAVVNKNISNKN